MIKIWHVFHILNLIKKNMLSKYIEAYVLDFGQDANHLFNIDILC